MDKTIKELAEEIGISKQALYKRIKREPLHTQLHTYVHTKGQTTYIDIHGQNLIKSVIKEDNFIQNSNTYAHTDLVNILFQTALQGTNETSNITKVFATIYS